MANTLTDQTFADGSYVIDGLRFIRCRFVKMQLIYGAEGEVDFKDCTFENCSWTFDDAAERMIGFLSTLHEQVRPEGPELVEGIFKSIQSRKVATIRRDARAELQPIQVTATAPPISVKTTANS